MTAVISGISNSANALQTAQVFSHSQRLVNFSGNAKEAFMTPATTRKRKPVLALSMLNESPVLYFRLYGHSRFFFRTSRIRGLPLCPANSAAQTRVRTNALIVPHFLPFEGPCGRMQ